MPSAATQFNSVTAREYQKKGTNTVRNRRAAETVRDAKAVSKLEQLGEIGELTRSNVAMSIFVQSAILRQQQPTQFKHLFGKGRKPGILDVCERLASAASTVFNWGKDQSAAMIVNGSFTQIMVQPGVPAKSEASDSTPPCGIQDAEIVPDSTPKSTLDS